MCTRPGRLTLFLWIPDPPAITADGCDDWGDENDGEKCHPRRGRCRMRAARLTGFGIIYRYLTEGLLFPG